MLRRMTTAGVVALAMLTLMTLPASPAYARAATHGCLDVTRCDYSLLTNGSYRLWSCDQESDGVQAVAQAETASGRSYSITDATGAHSSCYSRNPDGYGQFVRHRMCEPGNGCGGWSRH